MSPVRRCAAAAALALSILAFPVAARAQGITADPEDQVVLSGTVNVPRGSVVGEVVVFHGRATVAGVVDGDVVVLDGPITVSGQVTGSVIALNGPIRVAATAQVAGQVLGSGRVDVADGASIVGGARKHVGFTLRGTLAVLGFLLATVSVAASTLVLGLLLLLIAPRGLDRAGTALRTAPVVSCLWGLGLALVVPLIAVALVASILGLPLGLSALLGLGLLWIAGLAIGAFAVGRLLVREPRSRILALLAGWGMVAVLGFVPFVNLAVWVLGSMVGLGAGVVAAWRARGGHGRHRPGSVSPREDVLGLQAPPADSSSRTG